MKKLMILLFSAAAAFAQPDSVEEPVVEQSNADGSNMFVLSIRPEFASGFAAMDMGGSIELGTIFRKNLYATGELSGGVRYFGVQANIGKCLSKEWELKNVFGGIKVKNVFGGTAGFRNTLLPVKFRDAQTGQTVKTEDGSNVGIAGGFWKIMLGGKHNLDITNKIMFGYIKNPSGYDGTTVSYDKGFDTKYVLSIGYTLTKANNYKRQGDI